MIHNTDVIVNSSGTRDVYSWGYGRLWQGQYTNSHAGVQFCLHKRFFARKSAARILSPPSTLQGRAGAVRIKHGRVDFCFIVCDFHPSSPLSYPKRVNDALSAWLDGYPHAALHASLGTTSMPRLARSKWKACGIQCRITTLGHAAQTCRTPTKMLSVTSCKGITWQQPTRTSTQASRTLELSQGTPPELITYPSRAAREAAFPNVVQMLCVARMAQSEAVTDT